MTVVAAGPGLAERFPSGSRWIVQADVYFRGETVSFGYKLPGGYSQYQTLGREVLEGDEGCYLLAVPDQIGYAQAALCEPWACVEAAYAHAPRRAPKPAGALLNV